MKDLETFYSSDAGRAVLSIVPEEKQTVFQGVLERIRAIQLGMAEVVTPETCEQSPTVKAIITAISRRFAVTPVHVYLKGTKDGRATKELQPNHPVAKLLDRPNSFQTRVDFWQDAASWFARYGRFHAYKSRGTTGPIRELLPLNPWHTTVKQDPRTWAVTFTWGSDAGDQVTYPMSKVMYARSTARNGYKGDSPVEDVSQSIALEIAAEKFGSTFFANGAVPLMIFQYMAGSQGFKKPEDEKAFIEDVQRTLGGVNRYKGFILPKGIEMTDPVNIENDKAQFLETRRYQRTVIAGAWGVPPHLVGDLERATFNNVEQQGLDFTSNVIMPIGQSFEAAMERDLLTGQDRSNGIIIRFNFDSILRADFKSRQEGLNLQRNAGVISPNEWREMEGMNPIEPDDGGDDYIRPANFVVAGQPEATEPVEPNDTSSGADLNA